MYRRRVPRRMLRRWKRVLILPVTLLILAGIVIDRVILR